MLLELAALHTEHGVGKLQRLAVSFGKKAAEEMAVDEATTIMRWATSAEDVERLGAAKCSRRWYNAASPLAALRQAREDEREGGEGAANHHPRGCALWHLARHGRGGAGHQATAASGRIRDDGKQRRRRRHRNPPPAGERKGAVGERSRR